ncbi:ATP-binding protein [Heyndrickxia camelliae]|uniref:histidine kinase n=1 Tax=Heyndrickxia camelliae TaxID=1707093 RepID=A0A2N3LDR5_9BACI|nr:sensor histidine kinase [Heyndrickxia camelliae]PKR82746.1 histidine kinase [Heyndrickxia camelliae]
MSVKQLPIRWKITILSYCVVIFSLLIGGILLVVNIQSTKEQEINTAAMNTARTVAELSDVKKAIQSPNGWTKINHLIEQIRLINDEDYIVVMNMERIRYSHPVQSLLGTPSLGKDEDAAFAEHNYFSKARGELGTFTRAFFPIKDDNLNQIGVVLVGHRIPSFWDISANLKNEMVIILSLTLSAGLIGSFLLARHIKKQMFQLEPHQIARILEERTATFHAMNEGVIAIDSHEIITIFNEKAKGIFSVKGEVIGKPIRSVLEDTRLPEIVEHNKAVYNETIIVGGKTILSSRIPVLIDQTVVGAVAICQDRTEVVKMAEELTGVKNFVEALRVQNHEYMNNLHTIAGLIQLGKSEQALNLAFTTSEQQGNTSKSIKEMIRNDALAGLLLSKIRRGKELGIEVRVDPNSSLSQFPAQMDQNDIVVLLGNLIENAFESYESIEVEDRVIDISIEQNEETCAIMIEDNGCGIRYEDVAFIFDKGFTKNKQKGTGYGLYLVKQIVMKGNGDIDVDSHVGEGTSFTIIFPMNPGVEANG